MQKLVLFFLLAAKMVESGDRVEGQLLLPTKKISCGETGFQVVDVMNPCRKVSEVILSYDNGTTHCWYTKKCGLLVVHPDGSCVDPKVCGCPDWADECNLAVTEPDCWLSIKNDYIHHDCEKDCEDGPMKTVLLAKIGNEEHYLEVESVTTPEMATRMSEHSVGSGQQVGVRSWCLVQEPTCSYREKGFGRVMWYEGMLYTPTFTVRGCTVHAKAARFTTVMTKVAKKPIKEDLGHSDCSTCHIDCGPGRATITMDGRKKTLIEILIGSHKETIIHPSNQVVQLIPLEYQVITHTVKVRVFTGDRMEATLQMTCPPEPTCEAIKCVICPAFILNSQCYPALKIGIWSTLGVIGILLFNQIFWCSAITVGILTYFCRAVSLTGNTTWKITKKVGRTSKNVYNWAARKIDLDDEEEQNLLPTRNPETAYRPTASDIRFGRVSRGAMLMSVVLICTISKTTACIEYSTLTAGADSCTTELVDGHQVETCQHFESTRMSFAPLGADSCLTMTDSKGDAVGSFIVTAKDIGIYCEKTFKYFTRSYLWNTWSVHRCNGAGNCNGDSCAAIGVNDALPDAPTHINEASGNAHCASSCGCVTCNGCGLCSPSCRYHKNYLVGTEPEIWEVFECPTWHYELELDIRMVTVTGTKTQQISLRPGEQQTVLGFTISLIGIVRPEMPILGKSILCSTVSCFMSEASPAGQIVEGQLGDIQCPTQENAQSMRGCLFSRQACRCEEKNYVSSCICPSITMSKLVHDHNRLPLMTNSITIARHNDRIRAGVTSDHSMELQVDTSQVSLRKSTDKNTCTLTVSAFGGCYSCVTGAQMDFICRTDFGDAIGIVTCPSTTLSIKCHTEAVTQRILMKFTTANIKETCTVICPAGKTTFEVEGTLAYIPPVSVHGITQNLGGKGNSSVLAGFGSWDIFGALGFGDIWKTALAVIVCCLIGLLFVFCLPTIFTGLMSCFLSLRTRVALGRLAKKAA